MTIEMRKTGVDVIGDMPWGTHFCLFYETQADLVETLVPYCKAGLESQEFCLWVVAAPLTEGDAAHALKRAVPDFDRYLDNHSMEIVPARDWYFQNGTFDLNRVIGGWNEKLARASARGYAGVRVTGDTAWLEKKDWKDFCEYEESLNQSVANQHLAVLCTYPLASCSAAEILDVVRTHQFAVTKRHGVWDVIETAGHKQAKAEIKRLNEELEQRVIERTSQLTAVNKKLTKEVLERQRAEKALRESEKSLRLIVDRIPGLVCTMTPTGDLESANQQILDYTGKTFEKLQDWQALAHPDDLRSLLARWRRSVETGQPYEVEHRILGADGVYRWFHVHGLPLLDTEGRIVRWYLLFTDIDERKKAEEKLQRSEAFLAEAQSISHTGSFGWNVPSGEIYWSKETYEICAYDRTLEPTLELVLQRVHPDDRDFVQQTLDRATKERADLDFEHRLLMPDGSVKYLQVLARALQTSSADLEYVGAVRDVTAIKQAGAKIRQSERDLRQLLDLTPQHIAVLGADGSRIYNNQAALDYHGLTLAEWQNGDPDRVFDPQDYERITREVQSRFLSGSSFEIEARLRRKDGQYRWFLFRYNPTLDEQGRPIRWYAAATDIEDRRQAEQRLQDENVALREEIDKASMFEEIVGTSRPLQTVLSRISKVAPTDSNVLITGETGTGKELVARAIHKRSRRSSRAFVSVNCAAIPRDLIASELFGHEKGAFTGATQQRIGRFGLAEGGTIFLDEVGELPAETQIALLHVLQEHEFDRVGGTGSIRTNVRVIAATNRDLEAAIAVGMFRSDLFYRLSVFPIEIPPLRERREDIPLLVEYFIDRYAKKAGKTFQALNKKSLGLLQSYPWPGNIRELQNVIERSVIVCEKENFSVDESWLSRQPPVTEPNRVSGLYRRLPSQEKAAIEAALIESGGRVYGPSGAAAMLGIPRSTLESKIRSLKINKNRFKTANSAERN